MMIRVPIYFHKEDYSHIIQYSIAFLSIIMPYNAIIYF
jgi:hypothetical protein